jgi:Clp amino terminal domain, pathogenicity island component
MFEKFSDQAREVIVSAGQQAGALHHELIGTGHLLLGVLQANGSPAAGILVGQPSSAWMIIREPGGAMSR